MTLKKYTAFDPDWTVIPGGLIAESLEEKGWTAEDFAKSAAIDLEHVEALIAGTTLLTHDDALALEQAFVTPARIWEGLERLYREGLAAGKRPV